MGTAIDTRMDSTGRASFTLSRIACLSVVELMATPAYSHEEAGDKDHNRPDLGSLGNIGAQ